MVRDRFPERGRPRVEVLHLVAAQGVHLQVALHGEHLRHRVGDRRARGEHHAAALVALLDKLHLQEQVERPFAGGLRQAGHAVHLGDVKEVLELVGLVHEEPVDAQLLEGQRVVLAVAGGEGFQLGFELLFDALQFLDQPRAALCAAVLADGQFHLADLVFDEA